jgi:hypothetical protein
MENPALFPLHEDAERITRHARLELHVGTVTVGTQANGRIPLFEILRGQAQSDSQNNPEPPVDRFFASCILPPTGRCLFFLRSQSDVRLSRNFGEQLLMTGNNADGDFELRCPTYYVESNAGFRETPGWAIASPVNCTVSITYGTPRPISKVSAVINNFDFEYGNNSTQEDDRSQEETLEVEASGRKITFERRKDRRALKCLLDSGVLRSAALTEFRFDAWPGATEDELATFAYNVSTLCSVVARQHTGVPLLSFLDGTGRVVKRLISSPVESNYRSNYVLRFLHFENGLPALFRDCFEEHHRMSGTDLWSRLPWLCAGIEDPPYLEQKLATLMAAIELLIRSSLIEHGATPSKDVEDLMLPGLVGAARKTLRWNIPKHYTAKERHRLLRNAVAHGGRLPSDVRAARHEFDKWHLFLLRRYLLRLGFTGDVASPFQGFASTSTVGEFSEGHNSFA